ncbi:peptidyl-glycine alpha-amidating monooxygenase-like, partial [Saccostrea cucullata]|uniref:peptidyl-glycine alpha-amidating monooxygenase-like n=1 Tax=Saccostrea cuccullata TaxID=36930 RepID=UPI002ED4F74E
MHNLKFSLFTLCLCLFMVNSKETEQLLKISVPVTEVEHSDQYLCHAFRLDEVKEAFIRRVYVDVKSEMVHHVTLSICESPITNNSLWTCARDQGKTCTGNAVNINGYDSKTKNVGRYEFPK